jgi:hypothetical protein
LNEESEFSPQRHREHGGRNRLDVKTVSIPGQGIGSSLQEYSNFEFLSHSSEGKTKNQEINSVISVSSVVKRPFGKIGLP